MIIKCPECGREISDKAASCPGCGCPRDVWAGETKGERIVPSRAGPTPACGTVRNDMAVREAGPYGGSGRSGRKCPKCGGHMTVQAVSESRKGGCGMVLLYILLALTVIGILVIIPLALRKKTVTRTYAVCQLCGNKILLSED